MANLLSTTGTTGSSSFSLPNTVWPGTDAGSGTSASAASTVAGGVKAPDTSVTSTWKPTLQKIAIPEKNPSFHSGQGWEKPTTRDDLVYRMK